MTTTDVGAPIKVVVEERGLTIVFEVRAYNRATAIHEAKRYVAKHPGATWPKWADFNAYLKDEARDKFGIVGWTIE